MKSRFAIAAASALMLIAAPSALADESGSPDGGEQTPVETVYAPLPPECQPTADRNAIECTYEYDGRVEVLPAYGCWALADGSSICVDPPAELGPQPPIETGYAPLPPECQPTADRTAIECTYDYGDQVDVQPAFGCWSLADGSEICVDPPEIVPVPGCNYAAGECEIVFDPEADRCVIERGTSATVWIGREGQFYVIDWPWGADEELDAALIRNGAEFRDAIATGNVDFVSGACYSGQINGDESERPLPPNSCPDGAELCVPPMPNLCPDGAELCIPPMPGEVIEDTPSERFDSPANLSGARAQKGAKAKKAKKKSRGKKSKQKNSRR